MNSTRFERKKNPDVETADIVRIIIVASLNALAIEELRDDFSDHLSN
jgi:hypothetical protein